MEDLKNHAEMVPDEGNSANEEKVPDGKRSRQKVNRIDFHPVNTSVYDARWALPLTYEVSFVRRMISLTHLA